MVILSGCYEVDPLNFKHAKYLDQIQLIKLKLRTVKFETWIINKPSYIVNHNNVPGDHENCIITNGQHHSTLFCTKL